MKGDLAYLRHILEAIKDIEGYTQKLSREEFRKTKIVQDAVLRKVNIANAYHRSIDRWHAPAFA